MPPPSATIPGPIETGRPGLISTTAHLGTGDEFKSPIELMWGLRASKNWHERDGRNQSVGIGFGAQIAFFEASDAQPQARRASQAVLYY
jgi:hypothetical protein